MGFKLLTPDGVIEFEASEGHRAVMAYTRRVTSKQRATLMHTFDDALPERTLQGPMLIASYPEGPEQEAAVRRAERAAVIEAAAESIRQGFDRGSALRRHRDNEGTEHDDTLGPDVRDDPNL